MKWIKHYSNASTNHFMQALLSQKNGTELYGQYWLLMEFLCGEFKKDTTKFKASAKQLRAAMNMSKYSKVRMTLRSFQDHSEVFDRSLFNHVEVSENFYEIETPIILELMGKEFKRTRAGRGQDAAKNKNKNKNKIYTKPDGFGDKVIEFWNSMCDENYLPKIRNLNAKRNKRISIIRKDFPDLEDWSYAISQVPRNKFRLGENDSGWKANFDWLINSNDNIQKMIEERDSSESITKKAMEQFNAF